MQNTAESAMLQRNFEFSKVTYLSASEIFLVLDFKHEYLKCIIPVWQIFLMEARDEKDYNKVRNGVLELLKSWGAEIKANNLAFQINVLAADSAFFASNVVQDHRQKMKWLLICLGDAAVASQDLVKNQNVGWFERYVSLLSEIISQIRSLGWVDEEQKQIDELFAEIATNVEKIISVNFDYRDKTNLQKSFSTMENLAILSYEYGDPKLGSERFKLLAERVSVVDSEFWLFVLSNWYKIERRFNNDNTTLQNLRNTLLGKIETYRETFRSRAGRIWCAQILESILAEMLLDVLNTDTDEKVFELMERLKARTLLDHMETEMRKILDTEIETVAYYKEKELLSFAPNEPRSLLEFEMQLLSRLPIGTYFDRSERNEQQNQVEELYRTHDAGFSESGDISTLSEIKSMLSEGEVIIEYFMPPHQTHPSLELWVMVITKETIKKIHIPLEGVEGIGFIGTLSIDGRPPIDSSPLNKLITELRVAIQEGNDNEAIVRLQQCYDLLIEPLIKNGVDPKRFKKWIIVPHGVLHYLPFMALHSNNGFLIEDVTITLTPSASVWHKLKRKKIEKISTFLGLGNPDLSSFEREPLEEAEMEVEEIGGILKNLNCTIFKNNNATESILRKEAKGKNLIHFATHGDFPEQDIIDSHRILLTPTDDHDGLLNAKELGTLDLDSTWLAVLSICNGGTYRCGPGNEPYGLVPALFIAGTRNIVGSLWEIEDEAGRLYMVEFYKHLIENGPSEAARRVCTKFIQNKFPIIYWSSFVTVGPD